MNVCEGDSGIRKVACGIVTDGLPAMGRHLHTREVEVLRMDRDEVLIRTVLGPGERVCLSPLQVVVEGMQVRPLPDDEAGKGARS